MIKKFIFLLLLISSLFFVINISFAQIISNDQPEKNKSNSGTVTLPSPISTTNPQELIGNVIKQVLGIVGSLALVMFIYGGIVWMTSAGNSEKVEKGKNIIVWAVIGLVVIFSSYALVKFVIETAAG